MMASLRTAPEDSSRQTGAHGGGALLVGRVKGEAKGVPRLLHRAFPLFTLTLVSHSPYQDTPP